MVLAITIFTIVANLYLGFAVFLRNPKSDTHKLIGLYTFLVAFWAFSNYFTIYPTSAEEVILYIRIVTAGSAFMAPVIFLMSYTFPGDKMTIKPWLKYTIYIYAIFTSILSITPLFYEHVTVSGNFITPFLGKGFILYAMNVFLLPVLSMFVLFRKFRKATGRLRLQLQMFMWGIVLTYAFAEMTNFLLPNLLKMTEFVVMGPFFSLFLVGFVFYAITKYRFLDMKLLILRSVTYILLLGIVSLFYIVGLFLGLKYVFPEVVVSEQIYWMLLFLSIAVVIGLNPLYKGLEYVIGKFFFKKQYNSEGLVFSAMQIMASEVDFDLIAPKVLEKVMSTVGIMKGAILIVENHKIIDVKQRGFNEHVFESHKKLQSLEDIFHRLNIGDVVMLEDLEDESLKEVFRAFDAEVIFPVRIENREVALVMYGSRSAGDMYTARDIDVLKIIAKQVGDSIESTHKFKMLKVVDNIRSDFVNSVSHEFRTPLTESRWKLEHLLSPEYGKKIEPELKGDLTDIYFSIRWLVESLNQLITASDFQTSNPTLQKQDVDIRAFFNEEVFNKVQEITALKKTKLVLDVQGELPPIKIDVVKIKDAFSVLIENAIKYSPEGGEVVVRISKREAPEGLSFLQVKVIDQGIGIDPEDIPHMFSKFYRGHGARLAVPNGLGIGLFIAKTLIELHGGKISVESEKGKGTIFFVELPY